MLVLSFLSPVNRLQQFALKNLLFSGPKGNNSFRGKNFFWDLLGIPKTLC